MIRIPVAIITIWHPEEFAKISIEELRQLPALKKNRGEQESRKAMLAQVRGFHTTTEVMHERPVINFGKPKYSFRNTWFDGKELSGLIADYSLRLIYTEETGTQARFKLEARPNWGTEPNSLPTDLVLRIKESLSSSKVSVRQLWVNPFTIDTSTFPKGPFYDLGHTLNLAVGPYIVECTRKTAISFRRHADLVPIHQHSPFYRDSLATDAVRLLPECSLWCAEYP